MPNEPDNRAPAPRRGFAAMSPEQRQKIAALGGKAAHKKGTANRFDSQSGRTAGKKGGRAVSENKDYMASIGQKGGKARSDKMGLNTYERLIEHGNKKLEEKDAQKKDIH